MFTLRGLAQGLFRCFRFQVGWRFGVESLGMSSIGLKIWVFGFGEAQSLACHPKP